MVGSCNQLTETHNAFLKGDIFGISSNALVSKSLCNYFIGPIDVAKVDDDRAGYLALEARSSARNCSHSVTITSASAPSAQS